MGNKSSAPVPPPKPWPAAPNDVRSDVWCAPGVAEDPVGPKGGGKQLILVKRPDGAMKPSDFSVVETSVPTEVAEGEAIVQNVMLSLDPTHRIWASADKQYMPAVGLNTVMRAGTVGKVIKSSDEKALPVGSFVSAFGGVQEYVIAKISDLHPVRRCISVHTLRVRVLLRARVSVTRARVRLCTYACLFAFAGQRKKVDPARGTTVPPEDPPQSR